VLVTSNAFSILYYERMETNNNLLDKEIRNPIDSSQLSYKDKTKQIILLGRQLTKILLETSNMFKTRL